ncbi:MAG: FAD-dependent oxidoreductase [Prevotella sp.]|nr:FAD-dependent oxidoreductase [Prevotella sp.]
MRKYIFSMLIFLLFAACKTERYDVVIVGGTPGGIMAAIASARQGKNVVVLERSKHIGGLPVNGLGATDIATRGATTGLFMEFVREIYNYYVETYGEDSEQVKLCSNGYHFEPHVAALVFEKMLQRENGITILTQRQFDSKSENVNIKEGFINSITIKNLQNGKRESYKASVFIDATYEGDLGAASGVPFMIGREGKEQYNEIGAGILYKLWGGDEVEGSTGNADDAIQAYNYRLCLTNDSANRIEIQKPLQYNREEYLSLVDDVYDGVFTGVEMLNVTDAMHKANREHIAAGGTTQIVGDPWGIAKITNMVNLPNKKTDANNQHLAFISTDLPEENWQWPTADWEWRDAFAQRLKDYTLGLFWFAQNDSTLPQAFRDNVKQWGLAADEYADNDHFPRQVYVREGRRLIGERIFNANDALPMLEGARPPLYISSITASHYALDSHACHKRERGRMALDGFFNYRSAVYTVPYEVILPKKVENLLIPVPASATHVGFSTLRMEPCWMALGQAAGIAAAIAVDNIKDGLACVKEVDIQELQKRLIEDGATLIYYRDVKYDDPNFAMVQHMGLRGYLPEWEAQLDSIVDESTVGMWGQKSGISISDYKGKTRRQILSNLYNEIK